MAARCHVRWKAENNSEDMIMDYKYIDRADQLSAIVQACLSVETIAIDTEFARFNTYYPIVGLVQIYTGDACFLVDPVAIGDLTPLIDILSEPSLLKVLHSGSEDMEVFLQAPGVMPTPVFDTQVACAALGIGFSLGYQAMVERYLGISIPKDQTRSDWLARPLSSEQLDYAALDVIHLLEVYNEQHRQLVDSNKLDWVLIESAELGRDIPTQAPPEEAYLKFKGLWQFDRRQLNLMKVICAWRETRARSEDVPKNRIVDQKAIMAIVKDGLTGRQGFQQAGMSPRQVRKFGDELMFILSEARLVPDSDCPEPMERTDTKVNTRKLKLLRQVVEERARQLSVAPELLTKRRHLEQLIRSEDSNGEYHLPGDLNGWREAAIGRALLTALSE